MSIEPVFHVRQGDVMIIASKETIPDDAKPAARVNGRIELVRGKATGHVHAIAEDAAVLYQLGDGRRLLKIGEPAALVHDEHAAIDLPEGVYEVRVQREYVPGELPRNVED